LTIFPNPTSNFATLLVSGIKAGPAAGIVYDASGRVVKKFSFDSQNDMKMDLHDMRQGNYYIYLTAGKERYVQQFTVAH
jgi:hypothetical protein